MGKNVVLSLVFLLLVMTSGVFAYEFCEDGVIGAKNLRLISIDDLMNQNSKEWTFEPEEAIEIEARVENKDDSSHDYILEIVFIDDDGNKVNLAEDNDDLEIEFSLSSGNRDSVLIEFVVDKDADKDSYNMYVKVYEDGDEDIVCIENNEETVTIDKIELCSDGNVKTKKMEITEIDDNKKDNDDKWEWAPGNDIEITAEFSNNDYSERDFIGELIMINENGEKISFAEDEDRLKEKLKLDEDEDGTFEFDFKLNSEIDAGDYTLYVKTYDEDDMDICTSLKAEKLNDKITVSINRPNKKVIVTTVDGPKNAETGSELEYTASITNMGLNDEPKVAIIVYNRLLNIRKTIELDNVEPGESQEVTFQLDIPIDAKIAAHKLLFSTEFEYDEDMKYFRSSSEKYDDKKIILTLTQGEVIEEPEIIENTTEEIIINDTLFTEDTFIEEPIVEDSKTPETTITGNVVGKDGGSKSGWFAIFGLIAFAGIGIFLFLKKPEIFLALKPKKRQRAEPIVTPNVTRRYTARLN